MPNCQFVSVFGEKDATNVSGYNDDFDLFSLSVLTCRKKIKMKKTIFVQFFPSGVPQLRYLERPSKHLGMR